jgi:hypothetical protein
VLIYVFVLQLTEFIVEPAGISLKSKVKYIYVVAPEPVVRFMVAYVVLDESVYPLAVFETEAYAWSSATLVG